MVRATISLVLASFGYDVLEAGTVDKGCALIDKNPDVKIVLTDFELDEPSGGKRLGHEVIEAARKKLPGARVILMSGLSLECIGSHEAHVFMQKPISTPALIGHIEAELRELEKIEE